MQALIALCKSLINDFDLDYRWDQFKGWLTRDDKKIQRRIVFACCIFFISAVILLTTTCSGGPQIHPQ